LTFAQSNGLISYVFKATDMASKKVNEFAYCYFNL